MSKTGRERVDELHGAMMCVASLSNVRPEKRQAAADELARSSDAIAADLDTLRNLDLDIHEQLSEFEYGEDGEGGTHPRGCSGMVIAAADELRRSQRTIARVREAADSALPVLTALEASGAPYHAGLLRALLRAIGGEQ